MREMSRARSCPRGEARRLGSTVHGAVGSWVVCPSRSPDDKPVPLWEDHSLEPGAGIIALYFTRRLLNVTRNYPEFGFLAFPAAWLGHQRDNELLRSVGPKRASHTRLACFPPARCS